MSEVGVEKGITQVGVSGSIRKEMVEGSMEWYPCVGREGAW